MTCKTKNIVSLRNPFDKLMKTKRCYGFNTSRSLTSTREEKHIKVDLEFGIEALLCRETGKKQGDLCHWLNDG